MRKIIGMMCLMFLVLNFPVFGYMFANETGRAWPSTTNEGVTDNIPIEQLTKSGGSAFILSFSNFQKYLYLFEQDNTGKYTYLPDANNQMEIAYLSFYQAYLQTKEISCKLDIADALQNFDYDKYCEINGLIPVVFEKVKEYLKKCIISDWYYDIALRMENIMNDIKNINAIVSQGITPDTKLLWRLNQKYIEVYLEGQYIAEVFINATR